MNQQHSLILLRTHLSLFLLTALLFSTSISKAQQSPFIQVDQFGYFTNGSKVAVLSDPQIGFNSSDSYNPPAQLQLWDAASSTLVGNFDVETWNGGITHSQSGDRGYWVDFSNVSTPGTYALYDPTNDERSAEFEISTNPYKDVLTAAGRMFFYNRCNDDKPAANAGVWSDGGNFENPLQDANCRFVNDPGNASLEKDLTGGWFDAGDYNKYVTFAHTAVHSLLMAYEENPEVFGDDWNIKESGNGLPDLLDEVKWELDWLLKMSNPDGSVHIKMGSISYAENELYPPSANTDPRYYGPTCTSASIATASMLAHGARIFAAQPGYESYATTLENQANACFTYAANAYYSGTLETTCDDGTIKSGDADWEIDFQEQNMVVAASFLYALTGATAYDTFFVAHYAETEPILNDFWGAYITPVNDALLLYAEQPGADPTVSADILASFTFDVTNNWNQYYGFIDTDLYRAQIPDWSYHWGGNSAKANYGNLNMLAFSKNVDPANAADYELGAYELLHYFHGVNPLGLVHLSNMYSLGGDNCVNEIYHTWFHDGSPYDNALTSTYGPPPGYLTGGANPYFTVASLSPPFGQPIQKSYLDFNDDWPNNSWEISEPAIYYQAAYVRLLAWFVREETTTAIGGPIKDVDVYPNLIIYNGRMQIETGFETAASLSIFDLSGRLVLTENKVLSGDQIDISHLQPGAYVATYTSGNGTVSKTYRVTKL